MTQRPAFLHESEFASPRELYRDPFLKDSEKLMLFETLATFDAARKLLGGPLAISSGRRSHAHQEELRRAGYRAATYSPHCYGAALDVVVPERMTDWGLVNLFFAAAQQMRFPRPRVGFELYRKDPHTRRTFKAPSGDEGVTSTFVHFDFIFLMRGLIADVPDTIWNSWREGVSW